jgi:hypothetical protein
MRTPVASPRYPFNTRLGGAGSRAKVLLSSSPTLYRQVGYDDVACTEFAQDRIQCRRQTSFRHPSHLYRYPHIFRRDYTFRNAWPWRRRQQDPPKRQQTFTTRQGITSRKTWIFRTIRISEKKRNLLDELHNYQLLKINVSYIGWIPVHCFEFSIFICRGDF